VKVDRPTNTINVAARRLAGSSREEDIVDVVASVNLFLVTDNLCIGWRVCERAMILQMSVIWVRPPQID
jgi:hypothetical protein